MIDGLVAKRYAEALFEVANEKSLLEQTEKDLQLIVEVIKETEDLMAFLRHPKIDLKAKKELIETNFKDSISTISKNFVYQLIDSGRIEFIGEIYKLFVKYANDARGIVDVEAVTAIPLNESNKEKVLQSFVQKLGKEVHLKNTVDPTLLGGMVVKVGDRVYDGSINKQLEVLKRSLAASRV